MKTSEDRAFVNKIFEQTVKNDKFVARLLDLYNETYERTKDQVFSQVNSEDSLQCYSE